MTAQPAKLVFAATGIVRAARQLTLAEKAVWYEVWALDRCICKGQLVCDCGHQGDRCYAGTAALADRLGISGRTVEDARAALVRRDLLVLFDRRDARNKGLVATLPIELPQNLRLNDAPRLRDVLDGYILERDQWHSRKRAAEDSRKPAIERSGSDGGTAGDAQSDAAA